MDGMHNTNHFIDVGALEDITPLGARTVATSLGDIAIFRTDGDQLFALRDQCPHKQGPLSQGIIHGTSVTCPLHNWVISLQSGAAQGLDTGCTPHFPVKVEAGRVLLSLPSTLKKASAGR